MLVDNVDEEDDDWSGLVWSGLALLTQYWSWITRSLDFKDGCSSVAAVAADLNLLFASVPSFDSLDSYSDLFLVLLIWSIFVPLINKDQYETRIVKRLLT